MVVAGDYIGRRDNTGRAATTVLSVSGTVTEITAGLHRRDYVKVVNTGGTAAVVLTTVSGAIATGFSLSANGGSLEDSSGSRLWVVTGGSSTSINIFESLAPRSAE